MHVMQKSQAGQACLDDVHPGRGSGGQKKRGNKSEFHCDPRGTDSAAQLRAMCASIYVLISISSSTI